jgi:chromate transporter
MDSDDLLALVLIMAPLSLMSIGGGASVISGMESAIVRQREWLTPEEFLQAFAVSRAAPGPGTLLSTLIGWRLMGWPGAIAASAAFFLPSSVLFYTVYRASNRHREKKWHRVVREGLAPVGIGLMLAAIMTLFRVSGAGPNGMVIAAASAVALFRFPKIPALLVILAGSTAAVVTRSLW